MILDGGLSSSCARQCLDDNGTATRFSLPQSWYTSSLCLRLNVVFDSDPRHLIEGQLYEKSCYLGHGFEVVLARGQAGNAQSPQFLLLWRGFPSAPVRGAPAPRDVEELRPVPRDLLLSFSEIHVSALHLCGQVVLDHILLLEIALAQRARRPGHIAVKCSPAFLPALNVCSNRL
jgi:hypothetical protein